MNTADHSTEVICAQCTSTVPADDDCNSCGEPTALDARYRLEEIVGRGSFGMTYRATRLADGKTVAIKEMLIRRADTVKSVELFEREARVLERLDHPGIPRYHDDLWHEDGRSTAFFLVQEFIDGDVVEQQLGGGPNRPDVVFEMLAELLDSLAYLHEFSPPVVHRDVKPANLMIRDGDESLVLIDFGSVQAALTPEEGGSTVAGTFGYMAPEQLTGNATPKSDVYGAAATAVALLAGEQPDAPPGQRPDLSALNIDGSYRALLHQMLAPDADERPTAAEAADRLRRLNSGQPPLRADDDQLPAGILNVSEGPDAEPEVTRLYFQGPTRNPDGSVPSSPSDSTDSPDRSSSVARFTGGLFIGTVVLFFAIDLLGRVSNVQFPPLSVFLLGLIPLFLIVLVIGLMNSD